MGQQSDHSFATVAGDELTPYTGEYLWRRGQVKKRDATRRQSQQIEERGAEVGIEGEEVVGWKHAVTHRDCKGEASVRP